MPDVKIEDLFNESTIELMEDYFHVQDRDALLRYLRNTVASHSKRSAKE